MNRLYSSIASAGIFLFCSMEVLPFRPFSVPRLARLLKPSAGSGFGSPVARLVAGLREPSRQPSLPSRARLEQAKVDRHSHGQIAGAVWMEPVARSAGRAFRDEFRLEP